MYRLEDEARENEKRRDEIAELKTELRQKERCVAELSSHNDCLQAELQLTSTKLDKYRCEMDAANQRSVSRRHRSAAAWRSGSVVRRTNRVTLCHAPG